MIDFHNHILPCVDDGSQSIEISLNMLRHASNQGITDVVNTVHYQHPKVEGEDISFSRIKQISDELEIELKKNNIPIKIHLGAEVFFLPNLLKLKNDPLATFSNYKYMLIEFQAHQLPENHKQELYNLKLAGVTPIIAHPERYKFVQNDISLVSTWMDTGCLIMIDAGSPLGYFGQYCKSTSEKIIKNGWCHILGSDSHDDKKRNFCLKDSVEYVRTMIGSNVDKMVYDNPRSVINGDYISSEYEYEIEPPSGFFEKIKKKWNMSI